MNNRYLCRAKRIDNGEWVNGAYYIEPYTDKCFVIQWNSTGLGFNEFIEVDGATVCQCTGLKDKNGNLIYEHDIVREQHSEHIGEVKFGEYEKGYGWYIEWISERAKFYRVDFLYWQKEVSLDVIGNIFYNPELLDVECGTGCTRGRKVE